MKKIHTYNFIEKFKNSTLAPFNQNITKQFESTNSTEKVDSKITKNSVLDFLQGNIIYLIQNGYY